MSIHLVCVCYTERKETKKEKAKEYGKKVKRM